MKLNNDCVRSVLLEVEKMGIDERFTMNDLCAALPAYTEDDIHYTVLKLKEAGFLDVLTTTTLGYSLPQIVEIRDITYAGHEFLKDVRSDTIWGKVKDVAKKTGAFSIHAFGEIAKGVLSSAITAALSNPQQ